MFKVEEAASTETLKNVTEWFNTQHNVAVSIELCLATRAKRETWHRLWLEENFLLDQLPSAVLFSIKIMSTPSAPHSAKTTSCFAFPVVDHRRHAFNKRVAWLNRQLLPQVRVPPPHRGDRLRWQVHRGQHQRHRAILPEAGRQPGLAAEVQRQTQNLFAKIRKVLATRGAAYQRDQLGEPDDALSVGTRRPGAFANNHPWRSVIASYQASSVLLEPSKQ